jgi:glycosyltransferase involved in cell wall biosynthesis
MKICVISPGVVHAVPRTVAIADQFDEVHFVDMVGNADRNMLESHGIIYHGQEDADLSIIGSRPLQSLFKKIDPDAIVCHYGLGDHFYNALAYGRCPVVVIAMGHDVLYDEGDTIVDAFTRLLTRIGLRQSIYVSAKSVFLAQRIKCYGITSSIDVNYWGADLNIYYPGNQTEARRKLHLDENGIIILSSRALEPRLNIHLIVEAFHTVLRKYDNASLVILGRSRPDYEYQVKEIIGRLNLTNNTYIRGEVSQEVLSQYYQASDVVVSMGRSEGFPNTLLEVMACKVPIVVGRIAQIEELLADDKNAWICEEDSQAIAAAILNVLDGQDKRQRLTNAAYATVKQYADIKKNGITFSNELKRYCATNKRRSWIEILAFRLLYAIYRIQRKIINGLQAKYV